MEQKRKIVLIDGRSGAGKTTIARYLGEEMDYLAVEGDKMVFNTFINEPKVAKQVFGFTADPGEDAMTFAHRSYLPLTVEKEKLIFDSTREYVKEQLEWMIQNPDTDFLSHEKFHNTILHQPSTPKGVFGEIIAAHKLKSLGLDVDLTAQIETDKLQRNIQLSDRIFREGLVHLHIISIREAVQTELLKDSTPDVKIYNRYDQQSLINAKDIITNAL